MLLAASADAGLIALQLIFICFINYSKFYLMMNTFEVVADTSIDTLLAAFVFGMDCLILLKRWLRRRMDSEWS